MQYQSRPPIGSAENANRHAAALRKPLALLLVLAFPAALFAQQDFDGGPPPPIDQYQSPYDSGAQYAQPYTNQYGAQPYAPESDYDQPQPGYSQAQPMVPDQIDQLVAPIALNPDPLVALMLAASTYPQQIAEADQWRSAQGDAAPQQIAYGANQQNWDPSVKALTAFPQVLNEMDRNMQWTQALGNAYYNQPQDVLEAIQDMRRRAQAAGNLESTPQQQVSYDNGDIQLMPENPQVVYVPSYDPWTAYGEPVSPYPGFSLAGVIGDFGSGALQFGLGTVLSAFNSTPWGLVSWGLDWLTQNLLFNHSDYYSRSPYVADWGFRYGGPRAWMRPHGWHDGYGYGRNGYGYGRGFDRGYNRGYQNTFSRGGYHYRRPSPYAQRSDYGYGRSLQARNSYGSGYGSNYRFGSSFYGRSQSPFAGRSNYGYRGFASRGNTFNQRSNFSRGGGYRGNGFNGSNRSFSGSNRFSEPGRSYRSGGFGGFSSHGSESFGGGRGFKAPKYHAPKMHGGGFGGGHHSFGGGGHHGGGGGHHGGGGGHHGGGHHR